MVNSFFRLFTLLLLLLLLLLLVTNKLKSGGLHEEHVVATWNHGPTSLISRVKQDDLIGLFVI